MGTLYFILSTITAFAALGFILSNILKIANKRLFNIKKISEELISSTPWLKALAPFIAIFYLAINFVLWGVFAVEQILEFIVIIITWLKRLLLWVWNCIIEPTIIFVIKMVWHYPIVFIWKNTELAFSVIRPALSLNSLKIAAKELSKLMAGLFFLYILDSLINQVLFSVFALIVGGFASVYTLITVGLIFSNNKNIHPSRTNLLKRLSVIIGGLIVVGGTLILLMLNNEKIFMSEIGFPVSEIGIPIAVTLLFTLIMAVPFGVAHFMQSNSSMNFGQFFKAMIVRLPKLVYSMPFQALGILITLILPIAIYLILNQGITIVSGESISGHLDRVEEFSDIDNQYFSLAEKIDSNNISIQKADSILVSDSIQTAAFITEMNQALEEVNSKKTRLMQKEIFLLSDDFYTSERQLFSFPPIANCESFHWEITDSEDVVIVKRTLRADSLNSSMFSHVWSNPGSYTVSVVPKNACEEGDRYTAQVKVLPIPNQLKAFRISGPELLCANDTVSYSVADSENSFEWGIPNDASIVEGRATNKIRVVWGKESGVVSLRGIGSEQKEEISKFSYLKVMVKPILGKTDNGTFDYPKNDVEDFQIPTRSFAFYTLQSANDSIAKIESEIKHAENSLFSKRDEFLLFNSSKVNENESLNDEQTKLSKTWFSNLFSMIGLIMIFLLVLTPALSYFFKFNYSLYGFHEEGNHYMFNEWNYLKTKDPKQPLFGWFIVVLTVASMMTLTGAASFNVDFSNTGSPFENETIKLDEPAVIIEGDFVITSDTITP